MVNFLEQTPVTASIIAVTVLVSVLCFSNKTLFDKLKFNAYGISQGKQYWRFFTHAFVHADFIHLFFNMFVLWQFGDMLEQTFGGFWGKAGWVYYLVLYFIGILVAALPSYQQHKKDIWYNSVGASGAVAAVLFACLLLYPTMKLLLFGGLPMPAVVFGALYLVFSYYAHIRGGDNIAHAAHIGGALFGIVFMIVVKRGVIPNFIEQVQTLF